MNLKDPLFGQFNPPAADKPRQRRIKFNPPLIAAAEALIFVAPELPRMGIGFVDGIPLQSRHIHFALICPIIGLPGHPPNNFGDIRYIKL